MESAQQVSGEASPAGNVGDAAYVHFLEGVQERFRARVEVGPVFTTDAEGIWETYLATFPEADRQYHNCSACRRFLEAYGGLVTIGGDGAATSVLDGADDGSAEADALAAVVKVVRRAKVNGVFLSKERTWGWPVTGDWRHLSLKPPKEMVYAERALPAGQKMAEKREEFGMVSRALAEYPAPAVHQALALLKSEALYRSEKVLGPCQWLADLHASIEVNRGRRANIIWKAVALAPAGFCHPRSSMVGTLLDDIVAGVPFEEASAKFAAKMHPLQYQRPQAAPSAGNIAAADKLVEKLGVGPSLVRRFARIDEIEAVWRPAPDEAPRDAGGVFGHLQPKGAAGTTPAMSAPPQAMTWVKFAASVLPEAKSIEVFTPSHGNFTAILTANDPDAPPILQWDSPERRNPFSTYVYNGGSPASSWALRGLEWIRVTAIALQPHRWFGGAASHHADGAIVVIEGAKDTRINQGNALFPETLKADLHAIRSTVEAYSRKAEILGREQASACGLAVRDRSDARLRVTNKHGIKSEYRIDRFE